MVAASQRRCGHAETITEVLPHYFVDFQERDNRPGGAISWSDRVYPDGRWTGNVFDFFRKVVLKLTADLKVPFRLGADLQRIDDTPVHRALREALVNALVHADYEGRISVQVLKLRDGFEFRNPGVPRLPVSVVREGGTSDCRNRHLQKMFGLIGFGERAGSGFSRILQAWREQHWAAPSFFEDPDLDTTTLRLTTESLLDEDVLTELQSAFPGFPQLSSEARLAVATARIEGKVTNRRMQELCSVHPRDLTFMLKELVEGGYLVARGERRGTWYTVAGDSEDAEASQIQPDSSQSTRQSSASSAQSSTQSAVDSTQSSAQSSERIVARVTETRWAKRADVRAAILALCTSRFLSSREIATTLNRKQSTLRKNYLGEMVREGLLELERPAHPNAPNQAYRTVITGDDE